MKHIISQRLVNIVDALPLVPGVRILEIGCGPGAMARYMASKIGKGFVLGIDRSAKAIQQAIASSGEEIRRGRLAFKQVPIEEYQHELPRKFDFAIAVRVGALDGRHPEIQTASLRNIATALTSSGRLFIDEGDKLKEIPLKEYRTLN